MWKNSYAGAGNPGFFALGEQLRAANCRSQLEDCPEELPQEAESASILENLKSKIQSQRPPMGNLQSEIELWPWLLADSIR